MSMLLPGSMRWSLMLLMLVVPTWSTSSPYKPITVIDSRGNLIRPESPIVSTSGVVTLILSPGTVTPFDSLGFTSSDDVSILQSETDIESSSVLVITSPGATYLGTSSISRGTAAAAASAVADVTIVSGITSADLGSSSSLYTASFGGLGDTRHGHTLTQLFLSGIALRSKVPPTTEETEKVPPKPLLILTVHADELNEEKLKSDLNGIFSTVVSELGTVSSTLEDIYDVKIIRVTTEIEAKEALEMAQTEATSRHVGRSQIFPVISDAYTQMNQKAQTTTASKNILSELLVSEPSPSLAAALVVCEEAFARHHRTARAKITSWKSRTTRGLVVDDFGSIATQLLHRTMESYDRETYPIAGLAGSVATHRLELRRKLREYVASNLVQLFDAQVNLLEKSTLDQLNAELLRKHNAAAMEDKKNGAATVEKFFNDNAAAVRSAAFAFDTAMEKLEVPSLGLVKSNASRDMKTKLNAALLSFPESPAARLKGMKEVARVANKQKQPTERRIDFGLDLVAMIRPDGFGNFQGFAGYQLGGNNFILGVHNDADSPDVISQFGGLRPPFLRIQPKLKVDVEL